MSPAAPSPAPSPLPRLLLSRLVPVGLLAVVVTAAALALVVDDDATDTALGAVTGAATVLLLGAVLLQVLVARADRRTRDRKALDGLEPLRAAQRDSRRTAPRTPSADPAATDPAATDPAATDPAATDRP